MTSPALRLETVSSGYGASIVLRGMSMSVGQGEAVALLGKNGMGKTTLLRTVMGYLPKVAGTVHLGGEDVTRWPPHKVSRAGVAYASQEHAVFTELSVEDNLRLALPSGCHFDERFAEIDPLFPLFKSRLAQQAGSLSGGERKMLLVARALMTRPQLMLIDEITEGLQPSVIERIGQALLHERRARGTTMLLVEQNVPFALGVADRYLVLKRGAVVDDGDAKAPGAVHAIFAHLQV